MLNIIPIPAFTDNYIWLLHEKSKSHCLVVDPGAAEPVLLKLKALHFNLNAILVTHHHFDHAGGITELSQHYQVPVYGPKTIPGVTCPVSEGDIVTLPTLNINLQVLEIPGHTLDHLAFYQEGLLFCGDTLFTAGCGRVFEGTAAQMVASLAKLNRLPADTLIYCGHEYTTANLRFAQYVEPQNKAIQQRIITTQQLRKQQLPTVPAPLALERLTNPFLRCTEPSVIESANHYAQKTLADPISVFSTLRSWKNKF